MSRMSHDRLEKSHLSGYFHVIMPIRSDPGSPKKRAAIEDAVFIANDKLNARFPKYNPVEPVFVLSDLVHELTNAEFVLADLSLERPSCYYEVGVAEALGKPVYLIAQSSTNIHQTGMRDKVRYYSDSDDLKSVVIDIIRSRKFD